MSAHPVLRRSAAWGIWGAAGGIAFGALVGWYLADLQARALDCTVHLCEHVGLQIPIGMFFGCLAGAVLGATAAVGSALWRRRARTPSP